MSVIQQCGDTQANWILNNPIIPSRMLVLETDTGRFKAGDGVTHYVSLPYSFNTIIPGTATPPASSVGVNGDVYINYATSVMYGPKAGGAWPGGISLVGATGFPGVKGTVVFDFGAAPGTDVLISTVTGQTGITTANKVEACLMAVASSNNSNYNHAFASNFLKLTCGDIVNGVGFTIYAFSNIKLSGQFNIYWTWY